MKIGLVPLLSVLAVTASPAQHPYTEEQAITYAKSIDVQTLDRSLPPQRLEDWLQSSTPQKQTLVWLVEDTCWQKPVADEDHPLCAHVRVIRNGQWGEFLVQIGTLHKGIVGPPQLYEGLGIAVIDEEGPGINQTGSTERLSELPGLLDQPNRRIVDRVRKLYDDLVSEHPFGIPTLAEMERIRPFLSKRLGAQLQTARACEDDYFRQHPSADRAADPAWMKAGVFSGDGRPLPTWAFAYSSGLQKDGVFPVTVNLRYFPDPMRLADRMWDVTTNVIEQDGAFVVDDVRIFDRDFVEGRLPLDSPSHLLSESFAGCDGSHWIGLTGENNSQ